MPISLLRSSPSMVKMLMTSTTPAMTEKDPNTRNSWVNISMEDWPSTSISFTSKTISKPDPGA